MTEILIMIITIINKGYSIGIVYVPFTSEVISLGLEIYPDDYDLVSDMASGIFNGSYVGG